MNLNDRNLDDLTMIKGIGSARQRWLKESLDVRSFGDLAALSADEIESRLKADKQIASRETIEAWIAEADQHTSKAKRTGKRTRAVKGTKTREEDKAPAQEKETASPLTNSIEGDDGGKEQSPVGKEDWKPFASFVVEYQERMVEGQAIEYRTTAHHMEADIGTNWPGIEGEKHCRWMLEQLGDRISPVLTQESVSLEEEHPAQERAAEAISVARSPVKVEITQIRAFQPARADNPVGTGKPDEPFNGHLRGYEPFALEILFNIMGEAAAELTREHVVFRARAYVQDQSTGKSIHLGDVEPGTLVRDKLFYAARLPDVTLPTGVYRLFALVTLQAGSVSPNFAIVPEFKVVR